MDPEFLKKRAVEIAEAAPSERRVLFAKFFEDVLAATGFSLAEVAHQTRITMNFLEAFRSGELDKLPGEVFGRGFLRNICKLLDIEDAPIIDSYNACLKIGDLNDFESLSTSASSEQSDKSPLARPSSLAAGIEKLASSEKRKPDASSSQKNKSWLWPAFGAGVALVLVLWPIENEQNKMTSSYAVKVVKNAAVKTPTEPLSTDVEKELSENKAGLQENLETNKVSGIDTNLRDGSPKIENESFATQNLQQLQVVQIRALEPVRIKKKLDEGVLELQNLDPKTYEFRFEENAEFVIYDAAAVKVAFNGKPLGHLGSKGRIRKLSFVKKPEIVESSQ